MSGCMHLPVTQEIRGSNPLRVAMNTYNVAYFNWADKQIQFTEEEAESGLEAMKALAGLSSLGKF